MSLKMKNVNERDGGNYRCEITFGNHTVKSQVKLRISSSRVPPEITARCVPYSGDTCGKYLNGHSVVEKLGTKLNDVNDKLRNVIQILKDTNKLSKK